MSRSPHSSTPAALAVDLARQHSRQRAVNALLAKQGVEDDAVSLDWGDDLCLILTRSALARLQEDLPDLRTDGEAIDEVRRDMGRACDLALERDRRGPGVILKITSDQWVLLVKPASPAWVVLAIRRRGESSEFHGALVGLTWTLVSPHDAQPDDSPFPLWLLARADIRDRELALASSDLRPLDQTVAERDSARLLRHIREDLPESIQDLGDAFRMLQWERNHRERRSWIVALERVADDVGATGRSTYVISQCKRGDWPPQPGRYALGLDPSARWIILAPDPNSASRWMLHGQAGLASEVVVYELPEFQYARQASIVARLTKPWAIRLGDTALAATQMPLPHLRRATPELQALPGEPQWEARQEAALRLALADHSVCAIKGPPGTGKSTVIVGIIRRAVRSGNRVLLVAPTHVALDEVLGRIHSLKQSDHERVIVPARVAPSDERRSQVKPELEEYIASNLGRNLAQRAVESVRSQLAQIPSDASQLEVIRKWQEAANRLRQIDTLTNQDAQARRQLSAAQSSYREAAARKRTLATELHRAAENLNSCRRHSDALAHATREFEKVKERFLETQQAVDDTRSDWSAREQQLTEARNEAYRAERAFAAAKEKLQQAQSLVARRQPTGRVGRILERVFALHEKAQNSLLLAESERVDAERSLEGARKGVKRRAVVLQNAENSLQDALEEFESVLADLRGRLAPDQPAIQEALGDDASNWIASLPQSLELAVATASERQKRAADSEARLIERIKSAEILKEDAKLHAGTAQSNVEAQSMKLQAEVDGLMELGVTLEGSMRTQINRVDGLHAKARQELERQQMRRSVLQRWVDFYERQDGGDQLTAWALQGVNLVAATTQGIPGSKEFSESYFDLVICDESSRVTQGEILVPAQRAGRIVFVGDEKQLPPYVEADDEQLIQALAAVNASRADPEALAQVAQRLCDVWNVDEPEFRPVRAAEVFERAQRILQAGQMPEWPARVEMETGVDERLHAWRALADALTASCFDHVLKFLPESQVVRLSVQRRMVAEIADLVSLPVYQGDYQSAASSPISPLLTSSFRHPWVFVNTRSYCAARPEFREVQQGTGFTNEGEARAVVLSLKQHVDAARQSGRKVSLMVITFYLAQARYIESRIAKDQDLRRERVAVLPIDRCQGQEADVVVVSFVRTPRQPRNGVGRWLQDVRRLNVALTRARHSLVLIGNLHTLATLRGDAQGERLLAHLQHSVTVNPDHQIEQLAGL